MHLNNYHFYSSKNYLYSKPVKGLRGYGLSYRFAFNGKEKDNETYGEGNNYDFGARMLDVRLGRWFSTDAKEKKYPGVSTYTFTLNSPIIFKDPDGNDVVIAFTGGPDGGGKTIKPENAGTTGKILLDAQKAAIAKGVEFNGIVITPGVTSGSAVDNALSFIKENYKEGEKLIIYGYSYGGDFAVELSEKLKEQNIKVDLLVTIDASDGPMGNSTVNTEIPDNVKQNLNIYQEDDSGASSASQKSTNKPSSDGTSSGTSDSPGSNGGPNTAANPSKTKVVNGNLTNQLVTHGNIDEKTAKTVSNVISKNLSKNI